MPASALRNSVLAGQYLSEQVVADLLGRFRVSLDALAFRLHNVGLADARTRDRIRLMSSKSIALRSGRAADLQARNDRRVPENLLYRAIDAYVDGKISVRPLATLLSADPEILLQELSPPPSERVEKDDEDGAIL
jgi:Zn-dependent peptidase ImmA (M78 family)